jgi:hypothetical protein
MAQSHEPRVYHSLDVLAWLHAVIIRVQVVKKARLTKLIFNPKWPILLVGDDKGTVTSLKLSPNLRKRSVPEKGQKETAEELEVSHVKYHTLKYRLGQG